LAIKISVSFKDTEQEMLNHVNSQLSISIYIKSLIQKDMQNKIIPEKKSNNNYSVDLSEV
jgi:hypothetical protein